MLTHTKLAMLLVSVSIGYAQFAARVSSLFFDQFSWTSFIGYAAFLVICIVGFLGAAFNQNAFVRWGFAAVFAISGCLIGTYELTASDHMSYDAYINMVNASGAFHEAWGQHSGIILIGGLQAILLFFGIGLKHTHRFKWNSAKFAIVPILAVSIITGALFVRSGEGGRGLPPAFTGSAYSFFYLYEKLTSNIGPRHKVTLAQTGKQKSGDIILIIDESISGQYLDVNNSDGVYSGLKDHRLGLETHNFGLAASISNCSAAVNLTLRHGGTRSAYQRINNTMPSIWSYAKEAGYETIYIDVPRTGKTFNNLMDADEAKNIDQWIQFDDTPIQARDHAAAKVLAGYINDGKKQLIYLNKIGAHFPIQDKFPDQYIKFKPILPRGSWLHISDTGNRDGFSGSADSWALYRNSYRNTLLWNVGAFFDKLLEKAELRDATIIYTSDHGQNLHERGNEGVITHCSPTPQPEEGLVPLVVLESSERPEATRDWDWRNAAEKGFNGSSHFRIFPTVLGMMGYDKTAVNKAYGDDLFAINSDPFTFNYVFNARLGQKPKWKKILLNETVGPPVSDLAISKPGPIVEQRLASRLLFPESGH
jgi:glucan phosphoethanolaminetransferase (alkaline phosphatase superfamily)